MGRKRNRAGRSHSVRPVSNRPPSWCKHKPEEVKALVVKLAKDGNPPSKIGVILRDQHGIPLVKPIAGKTITEILGEAELAPKLPEDLNNLIRKAVRLRRHLDKNKRDYHNKHMLQIIESKLRRLAKYYKHKGILPEDWKYEPKTLITA